MKAVILAGGLGTRLLPFTKEIPKEMIPVYSIFEGRVVVKPIIQLIFEQLFEAGVRNFYVVVGYGKTTIINHFTPNWNFVEYLQRRGKSLEAKCLENFYEKVEKSSISWVYQEVPLGTGHAILKVEEYVDGPFIVCAGDSVFLGANVFTRLLSRFDEFGGNFIVVKSVDDPRRHGVAIAEPLSDDVFRVIDIIEKPEKPPSNLANMSCYIFQLEVFKHLKEIKLSSRGEYEVTDAIRSIINSGSTVYALNVSGLQRVDVGTPSSLIRALTKSYEFVHSLTKAINLQSL